MKPVAESIANRDDSVALNQGADDDGNDFSSEVETSGWGISVTPSTPRGRMNAVKDAGSQNMKQSLQDRMFNKLFSQIIPTEDPREAEVFSTDASPHDGAKKPDFSLPVMGNNFRRFNARIGVVFVFQEEVGKLLSWNHPTHTLSLLAVYSFLCLDPYLIVALPLMVALLSIMVPAFASRHPPPPPPPMASSLKDHSHSAYSYSGPALAPPKTIKPAPETSTDFFRNMRDLQNTMADFSDGHDLLVSIIAPATNFSNEVLSSTIFLYLTVLTAVLFISAHLIPFRLILLLGGDALIVAGHPKVQSFLVQQHKLAEKKAAQLSQSAKAGDRDSTVSVAGMSIALPNNRIAQTIQSTISTMSEITLSTMPETREVEVFELQHRPILSATSLSSDDTDVYEWTPHLFTPTPFDPLSPARIAGERPRGTRFFEDVQPPSGWEWSSKKWQLDLEAGEWVSERLIVGVEYDIIQDVDDESDLGKPTAGKNDDDNNKNDSAVAKVDFATQRRRKQSINLDFGGWVWDLPPAVGSTGDRNEEVWLAYGDYDIPSMAHEEKEKGRESRKGHKKNTSSKGSLRSKKDKDWEENVTFGNKGRTGEWRRRRWVRVVKRKPIVASDY